MLKRDNFIILLISLMIFLSCQNENNKLYKEVAEKTISPGEYKTVYNSALDSISMWKKHKIQSYVEIQGQNEYMLDSLLCFNKTKDRFVSTLLARTLLKNATMDGLGFFYGEKIENKWYFFGGGASVVLPRGLYQKDSYEPLSFEKLHEIALDEVYKGYLNQDGEINEAWFTFHFEGPGWCNCKTRAEYEKVHLEKVNNNWYQRDTTKKELLP